MSNRCGAHESVEMYTYGGSIDSDGKLKLSKWSANVGNTLKMQYSTLCLKTESALNGHTACE